MFIKKIIPILCMAAMSSTAFAAVVKQKPAAHHKPVTASSKKVGSALTVASAAAKLKRNAAAAKNVAVEKSCQSAVNAKVSALVNQMCDDPALAGLVANCGQDNAALIGFAPAPAVSKCETQAGNYLKGEPIQADNPLFSEDDPAFAPVVKKKSGRKVMDSDSEDNAASCPVCPPCKLAAAKRVMAQDSDDDSDSQPAPEPRRAAPAPAPKAEPVPEPAPAPEPKAEPAPEPAPAPVHVRGRGR